MRSAMRRRSDRGCKRPFSVRRRESHAAKAATETPRLRQLKLRYYPPPLPLIVPLATFRSNLWKSNAHHNVKSQDISTRQAGH
jgi:hypothetical protein